MLKDLDIPLVNIIEGNTRAKREDLSRIIGDPKLVELRFGTVLEVIVYNPLVNL